MPKERKFINPLLQPTERQVDTTPETEMTTVLATQADTESSTEAAIQVEMETAMETETVVATEMETQTGTKSETAMEMLSDTSTSTSSEMEEEQFSSRHYGAYAFEKTHERVTLWLDKGLNKRFKALARKQGRAKSALLNEAIFDLLKKHDGQSI